MQAALRTGSCGSRKPTVALRDCIGAVMFVVTARLIRRRHRSSKSALCSVPRSRCRRHRKRASRHQRGGFFPCPRLGILAISER